MKKDRMKRTLFTLSLLVLLTGVLEGTAKHRFSYTKNAHAMSAASAPFGMAFPLKFRREDNFGSFHMITDLTISANGRFDAVTEINNHVHLKGNCGTVTIYLLDQTGNVLYRVGGQQYCVDGKSIFVAGPSVRKVPWDFHIPPGALARVAGVSILHGEGSKSFWDITAGHLQRAQEVLQKCPDCLKLAAAAGR